MTAVLAAEWTKLRSVRSTYWFLLAGAVASVGLAALITYGLGTGAVVVEVEGQGPLDAAGLSLFGVWFGQVAFAVVGVLAATSEYATGTIRSSLAAVPRRGRLLAAKLALVGAVTAVVGSAVSLAAFLVGQAILAGEGLAVGLGDTGVAQAVVGAAGFLMTMALVGVAVGTLLRHTTGAVLVALGLGLVPTLFAGLFPEWLRDHVLHYLPGAAGSRVSVVDPAPLATDYLVLGGWVAGLALLAYLFLRHRDAG